MKRKLKIFSLRSKILIIMAVSILILIIGIMLTALFSLKQEGAVIEKHSKKILSKQTENFLELFARERIEALDVKMNQAKAAAVYGANFFEKLLSQYKIEDKLIKSILISLYRYTSYCSNIYFISNNGKLKIYPPLNPNLKRKKMYKEKLLVLPKLNRFINKKNIIWSEIHPNPFSTHYDLIVDAVAPIVISNKIYGFIGVSISLAKIMVNFNQFQVIPGSYSFLMNTKYQLVAAPPQGKVELTFPKTFPLKGVINLKKIGNKKFYQILTRMVLGETSINKIIFNNEAKYIAYHPLKNINWVLGLVVPVRMVTSSSKLLVNVVNEGTGWVFTGMISWTVFFFILAIIAGILLIKKITDPIQEMSRITNRITKGHFDERIKIQSQDEIGLLGNNFNSMANKIQNMIFNLNSINKQLNIKNYALKKEIEEKKRAEESLKNSEERFRRLAENAKDMIYRMKLPEGIYEYVSPAVFQIWGVSPEYFYNNPKIISKLIHPDFYEYFKIEWKKLINGNMSPYYEYKIIHKSGEERWLNQRNVLVKDEKGNPTAIEGIVTDVTERKKMQEILIQSEKMISIGNLAAGIAHEINNPLGIILQGLQMINRRISLDLEKNKKVANELGISLKNLNKYLIKRNIYKYIDGIQEAGSRASKIIKNMLNFSRKSSSLKVQVNLNDIIENSIFLAEKYYNLKKGYDFRHINIVKNYDEKLTNISVNSNEIEQVLLNLLKNSTQEMEDINNPEIIINTRKSGDNIFIEIIDNGKGMEDNVKKHIFEPFFTTKKTGIGTGLGLSISYYIITENHNGQIWVESERNKGTQFTIKLPFSKEDL